MNRYLFPNLLLVTFITTGAISALGASFEVSTVKPNAANDNRILLSLQPGGRFVATGVTLKLLLSEAYGVRDFQVSGGPAWLNTERWDITAKAEGTFSGMDGRIPLDEFRVMLRSLIEERFQLKVRREDKEMAIYALVVAKGGPKLTPWSAETSKPIAPPPGASLPPPPPGGSAAGNPMARQTGPFMRMGRGVLDARKIPIKSLTQPLGQTLGRIVVDRTGLEGEYDFTLTYTPDPGQGGMLPGGPGGPPPNAEGVTLDGPSIFTAIQEQLGLRLDSTKGPVEMIVVEKVDRPTDN